MKKAKLDYCNSKSTFSDEKKCSAKKQLVTSKHFCKTEQYPSKQSGFKFEFYLLTLYYVLWLQVTSLTRLQIRQ
ncbi:hypothetical protein MUK42_36463 [Musa troglodytarum]|uniref:Uncharacterized protein n=1 Tax=Musa troglodytarum TaxID=320322 RepID=A0A9E7GDZ0_9LILI|nr:hypothetical protein MUK42_36463 [Musa troglodytarum]